MSSINDLDLKVSEPLGPVYWGNCGAWESNVTLSTCTGPNLPYPALQDPSDRIFDTVENVFVENPATGFWTITITAANLTEDGHVETPSITDVDYALVVTKSTDVVNACCLPSFGGCINATQSACEAQGGMYQCGKASCNMPGIHCPSLE